MGNEIRTYNLRELSAYIGTGFFASHDIIPVSSLRAASYLMNPCSVDSDVVLAEYYLDGQLIAYRTVLPDIAESIAREPVRFAWLSGAFVKPEFRRKGVSTALLEVMEEKWEGRLMFSNYAPVAKALFDHTGRYIQMDSVRGTIFYLHSPFYARFSSGFGPKWLLRITDTLVNMVHDPLIRLYSLKSYNGLQFREIDSLSSEMVSFIREKQGNSLFFRDAQAFNWIRDFPWVRIGKPDNESWRYNFSHVSPLFFNRWFEVQKRGGEIGGFIWIKGIGTKISVPYLFVEEDTGRETYNLAASLLAKTAIQNSMVSVLVNNSKLEEALRKLKLPFLFSKSFHKDFHVHRDLYYLLRKDADLNPGDGDGIFT